MAVELVPIDLGDVSSLLGSLATFVVVVLTFFAVRSGRAAAEAASAAAQLAERQLQEAHRPLLVPEPLVSVEIASPEPPPPLPAGHRPSPVEKHRRRREEEAAARPPRQDLTLPLRNIGVGPAMNVFARIRLRDTPPEVLGRFPTAPLPGIAAGGDGSFTFRGYGDRIRTVTEVLITYEDAAGREYTTDARWKGRERVFARTSVKAGDHARLPVKISIAGVEPPPGRARRIARWILRRNPAPDPNGPRLGDITVEVAGRAQTVCGDPPNPSTTPADGPGGAGPASH